MKLLSDYLGVGNKIDLEGVFDPVLDIDANYFINIKRLNDTEVDEFKESYKSINNFFKQIGLLLANSKCSGDKMYREAIRKFPRGEVNGIGLGYSKGKHGSGIGGKIVEKIIKDAKEIIDTGINEPEIFHLVGLFEEKVGPDRLSDMFANIIEIDIENYTRHINSKLGINKENYPQLEFDGDYLINPYKASRILLLPKDILHELPIADEWEDIDRVCMEMELIRAEINGIIGDEWSKLSKSTKKEFIRKNIMNNPKHLNKLLSSYKSYKVEKYDFENDKLGEYKVPKYVTSIAKENPLIIQGKEENPLKVALIICNKFKDLVENNKLYELLYTDDGKARKEKISQLAFYGISEAYCQANNLDISPEANAGRGPVDFKLSRGYDEKIVIEMKLTTNPQLIHGFKEQIIEYSKAEKTNQCIYLVIDNGGPKKRLDTLKKVYDESKDKPKTPILIIIDANPKESASKYKK